PSRRAAQIKRIDDQVAVVLERGALAVVNRSARPVIVEVNGVRVRASGTSGAIYEVAVNGTSLKVMARKGTAVVKASDRTVEVKEGTTLDATAPQGTVGAGGVGPIWTAVLVSSTAAGFTGLGLGIKAVSRPKPQNCVVVDRKSTRLNSSHGSISYAVFCLKKKRLSEKGDSRCALCRSHRLIDLLTLDLDVGRDVALRLGVQAARDTSST